VVGFKRESMDILEETLVNRNALSEKFDACEDGKAYN
jgi:hypothetical protein